MLKTIPYSVYTFRGQSALINNFAGKVPILSLHSFHNSSNLSPRTVPPDVALGRGFKSQLIFQGCARFAEVVFWVNETQSFSMRSSNSEGKGILEMFKDFKSEFTQNTPPPNLKHRN